MNTTTETYAPEGLTPCMLQALRQMGSVKTRSEPRLSRRQPWVMQLEVILDESMIGGNRAKAITVDTLDLSQGGFGFTYDHYIHIGATVSFTMPTKNGGAITGIVKHCTHLKGNAHRIGVQFQGVSKD